MNTTATSPIKDAILALVALGQKRSQVTQYVIQASQKLGGDAQPEKLVEAVLRGTFKSDPVVEEQTETMAGTGVTLARLRVEKIAAFEITGNTVTMTMTSGVVLTWRNARGQTIKQGKTMEGLLTDAEDLLYAEARGIKWQRCPKCQNWESECKCNAKEN